MDNIFDDEEIIEGSIYDIFHSMDKDILKAKAEGIVIFHNTLVEGGLDEGLVYDCVINQFFNIFF